MTTDYSAGNSEQLHRFIAAHPRLAVLTGAGISLAAGIPTYRDSAGNWQHSEPIKHRDFLSDPARRQRYWARSMQGWPAVRNALPTPAHRALADLEQRGHVDTVITQNVDRLHQRAGSRRVIDLHGRLDRVRCLGCDSLHPRQAVQDWLSERNGEITGWAAARPDGDSELPAAMEEDFRVPECGTCRGTLIPDVVFFGANVPRSRVEACTDAVARADALLVIGSSLQVFSGFRFCRLAVNLGKPLALINPGMTRADGIAQLKIAADCQHLLPALVHTCHVELPLARPRT